MCFQCTRTQEGSCIERVMDHQFQSLKSVVLYCEEIS